VGDSNKDKYNKEKMNQVNDAYDNLNYIKTINKQIK